MNSSPRGRRLRRLVILALALHGTVSLADTLTDRVAAAFNQEDPKLQATVKSDDEIHLTAPIGSLSVFLDHVRAECTKRPADCDSIVKRFAQATVASAHTSHEFSADKVYPVIRAASTLRAMQGTPGDKTTSTFVSRPYISGAILDLQTAGACGASRRRRDVCGDRFSCSPGRQELG
jgi:hypothetical protein